MAVLTAAALLTLVASPVWATVSKGGYKGCTVNQTQKTTSLSTGITKHYPGPSGYAYFNNGGSYIVRNAYATAAAGGNWLVTVDSGSLDDAGTYASCVNGTP
jgi:hypothetical protein